ncbi:unnamed protein product [Rotaria magnacalcarata]|uniref:CDK5 regulatory subunit-associated protein 3 n=2 Tax=Rotaria magnacalcarata TaxID=392030 RepID=A0A814ZYA4_9BILA|nr:unnamed protein product [Rotaria magnacalcarata]CAF1250102.1 unnamed protein product [Rotaria magnacalcarata]CAF1920914.1 unnamed protein product [Rotaria magnacalcarata]CAF3760006.1 unnamed protein product [Rotaria magnacalcarata]CAF3882367.1 unnamed protein product [Rotaria magnacalcarata]
MTIDDSTIDIHFTKLVDWLVDRRHCSKDWNERSIAIRAKIQQAILDLPEHDEIKRLLGSSYLDYFCCLKIVEILKETEKESKNMFGMYSSQRMKDWRTVVSNYEKNSVYLVECAQILQRNVAFEIPALKKTIGKCQQIREECHTRHAELDKNIHEIEKQYAQLCNDMSIKGDNVQRELIQRIECLPSICTELASGDQCSIPSLKAAVEFYIDFMKHFHSSSKSDSEEFLSVIKYLIENGNTTVYQWRTGGHIPASIERLPLNYKFAETTEVTEDEPNIILGLDDDSTTSIEGIEVKQTANQTDVIDFDTEAEIDWSAIDTVPELLDPALSSNGNHPNLLVDALQEAALNGSNHPIDDGIARGNDALTLLENRATYTLFIHELHRLQSFLKQRLNEYHVNETILMTFIMQNAPASIQKINENDLKTYLKNIDSIFQSISHRQLDRLFSMRDSYKFVDRLINCFQQKKLSIERNRFQEKELEEKASSSLTEEQQLKEKLNLLISYTKQLKEQVAKEISLKKCQNRRINIMGEINIL